MLGFFGSKKTKSPIHEVARGIFNVYVANSDFRNYEIFAFHERGENFNQILTNRYFSKIRLYRKAIAIYCLLEAEKKDKAFQSVLHVFEALIFPPGEEEGRSILAETTSAMDSLDKLIHDSNRGMSWAKVWFSQIGVQEDNPVRLLMLSLAVLEDLDILRKAIIKLQPV